MSAMELIGAAGRGDLSLAKMLIASGTDVNARGFNGMTALHGAAIHGKCEMIEMLVRAGARIDPLDGKECTPLTNACSTGKVKGSRAAILLIKFGADVNHVRRLDERTPLKAAIERGTPDLIRALIAHGAAVDGPRRTAQTPLMIAAKTNTVAAAKVLVECGADINRKSRLPWAKGKTAEEIAVMSKAKKVAAFLRECRLNRT